MKLAGRHQVRAVQQCLRRLAARLLRWRFMCIALSASLLLPGCGGYARENGSKNSGIEVYGTIDAGIQRERSSR
jgi:hypothetical protein